MHIKGIEQKMRLVAPTLLETLELCLVKVSLENWLVKRMCTGVDNDAGSLARTQTAHISQAVLRHDNVEVVLGLVDMGAHGDDAADAVRVCLAGACRRRVHDAVLGTAEEVGGATQAVQHTAAHDAGAVCVGVNVHLHRRVHPNHAKSADDLGGVGHLLASEQKPIVVRFPVVIKSLESLGRESYACGRREVEMSRVEEVEEGVLDHLGPDLEVPKIAVLQAPNDGVGDVADAALYR